MKNHDAKRLQILVWDIVVSHPEGLTHAELVRSVLQAGYRHTAGSLSEDLMRIVMFMVHRGLIQKNLETRLVTPAEPQMTGSRQTV